MNPCALIFCLPAQSCQSFFRKIVCGLFEMKSEKSQTYAIHILGGIHTPNSWLGLPMVEDAIRLRHIIKFQRGNIKMSKAGVGRPVEGEGGGGRWEGSSRQFGQRDCAEDEMTE